MKGLRVLMGVGKKNGTPTKEITSWREQPIDWRTFQSEALRARTRMKHKQIVRSLVVLTSSVCFFALSLGVLFKDSNTTLQGQSSEGKEHRDFLPAVTQASAHDRALPHVSERSPHAHKGASNRAKGSNRLIARAGTSHSPDSLHDIAGDQRWMTLAPYVKEVMERLDAHPCVEVALSEDPCRVCTTLDTSLQSWLELRLRKSMAFAAVAVVTEPVTGKIRALASYNSNPWNKEAGFYNTYPAASLFKIVTATAAVDRHVLQPESLISYSGHPYGLSKSSLRLTDTKGSERITLSNAFARSINPVFGKIGLHLIGPKPLSLYGEAFFFNRPLPTELPVEKSYLEVPEDDPMGIAGIASGLNHSTRISPIHAVWIGSVILNGGAAPMPWLVERVEDSSGTPRYSKVNHEAIRVISRETADKIRTMMRATITEGTCKRRFAGWQSDPVLGRLELGGKTGNVNNDESTRKYDWFVGYGVDSVSGEKVTVSVLVIHSHQIGHRANQVARDVIKKYFD